MAQGPTGHLGESTFERIESETDAAETTAIHVEIDLDTEEESVSPIATNSSSNIPPGNTRTRGYLDNTAQDSNLATPPRVTIPQTGSGITEFLMSPGSAVTEGSARACTAGSGSDSGNQDIETSQKHPVRQSSTSPKLFCDEQDWKPLQCQGLHADLALAATNSQSRHERPMAFQWEN